MEHSELMRELNRILNYLFEDEKPKQQKINETKLRNDGGWRA